MPSRSGLTLFALVCMISAMHLNEALPIYHLTPASYYQRQPLDQPYQPPTLAQEGFIHCTAGAKKLVEIANIFFANLQDQLLALEIDPAQLTAPLIFEPPTPPVQTSTATWPVNQPDLKTLFPHIYGPIDRQAIINCFALQRDERGQWQIQQPTPGDSTALPAPH